MNKPHKSFSVNECKIKASILLKSLYSQDILAASKAAKRFQRLPEFNNLTFDALRGMGVKRKHALAVIALEKGFQTWADLKCQLPFIRGGFLNHWFVNYIEAKSYQKENGGFLLPYKNQFFVCDADYINHLGLNASDQDWKLIDFDWVNPKSKSSWRKLYNKWMKIQENSHE